MSKRSYLILILVLVVALFLSIASMGIAGRNKALSPRIEKVTFVHYEMPSHYSKPTWDDEEDDFRLMAGGAKWFATISYEVNPAGSDLAPGTALNTLEASSETWDDAIAETGTSFVLFASPTLTGDASIGYDGTNRVIWKSLDPGVIAVTHLWWIPPRKEIIEFDMVFNDYYTWSTTGESDAMDLQNIATHEFGHNGLGDLRPPKDWALTMYAYSSLEEIRKRDLGYGDILGIQRLYDQP